MNIVPFVNGVTQNITEKTAPRSIPTQVVGDAFIELANLNKANIESLEANVYTKEQVDKAIIELSTDSEELLLIFDSKLDSSQKDAIGGIPVISDVTLTSTITGVRNLVGDLKSNRLYITNKYQEGDWFYDSTDTTSADDTGTVLVTSDGKRIKRIFPDGVVNPLWFGAIGDGLNDDRDAFIKACKPDATVLIPRGKTILIGTSVTLDQVHNIRITGDGTLKFAEGARLTFTNSSNVKYDVKSTLGNKQVRSTVSGLSITPYNLAITVTDTEGDDFSRFSSGDSIQTYKYIDGIRTRSYRGKITSIVGNIIQCTDDNSLGGSSSRASIGDEIIAIQAARYTGISFTLCKGIKIDGYFETVIALSQSQDYKIGDVRSRFGGMSVTFCFNGILSSYYNDEANFYGYSQFKSRNISNGQIVSDNSQLGGVVSKANWDTAYDSIIVRRAGVYAAQFRNDSGTIPNLINPNLQTDLNSYNNYLGSFIAIDSALGLWLDQTLKKFYIGKASIDGTLNGASVLCEVTADGEAGNIHIGELNVTGHFKHGVPTGYFESNSPLRFAAGSFIQIDSLVMTGCLHVSKLISTTSSGVKDLIINSAQIEDCLGEIEFSGLENVRASSFSVKNPRATTSTAISINACKNVYLDFADVSSFHLVDGVPVINEFTYGFGVTVSGLCKNVRVNNNKLQLGITEAAIALYTGTSDIIEACFNEISSKSTYGTRTSGGGTRTKVIENDIDGPITKQYTTDFTSIDARIEGKVSVYRGTFSGQTIAAGAAPQIIDIIIPGIGPSGKYLTSLGISGSKQGLSYDVDVPATNVLRIYRYNRSSASINAQERSVSIKFNTIA